MTVERDGLSADQRQGEAGRRHRPQLRLQAGEGGRGRLEGVAGRGRGLQQRQLRAGGETVRGGDRAITRGARAPRQPGAGLLPFESSERRRRQPRKGRGARAGRRRDPVPAGQRLRRDESLRQGGGGAREGPGVESQSGHRPARRGSRVHAGRGLFRPGQDSRGRGPVRPGAGRQAGRGGSDARHGQGPLQQERGAEGAGVVRPGGRRTTRARPKPGRQRRSSRSSARTIVKGDHCDQAHRRRSRGTLTPARRSP